MKEAEVKDLADGRYGIYIGDKLLGIAKTERQADLGVSLIESAIDDATAVAYDDGLDAGRDEGYNNASTIAKTARVRTTRDSKPVGTKDSKLVMPKA